MPSPSKAKGSAWERDVAEHLTNIFGLNHSRVPNSGAFTGRSNSFRLNTLTPAQQLLMVGDIIMPEQLSKYCIECKFYKEFQFHHLFEDNLLLDKWIEQSRVSTRCWFIIFKANRTGGFVVYDPNNQAPVTPHTNYMSYKGLVLTKLDGFFEKNKDVMLKYNQEGVCQSQIQNSTLTTLSSISSS